LSVAFHQYKENNDVATFLAVYTGAAESHAASGWDTLADEVRGARVATGIAR
jgi:hypothetical protein